MQNNNRVKHYLSLIYQKSIADLVSEARRGYLGILWWVIEPILYMSVFYLIFVVVFDRGGENGVSFLLTGLVVWKFFGSSVPPCSNSIPSNMRMIRQVYIPKMVFPAMVVTTASLKYIIVFILLLLFLQITGKGISASWFTLPILIAIQFLMVLSIGSVLAAIVPFLPDLKLIVDNAMMLLFFLSGVFFDISKASPDVQFYLHLNPMVTIIENFRSVLLDGVWPDWTSLSIIFFFSLLGLVLGWWLLNKFDRTYPKVI